MKRYTVFLGSTILAIIGTLSAVAILVIKQQWPDLVDCVIVIVMWLPAAIIGFVAWLES